MLKNSYKRYLKEFFLFVLLVGVVFCFGFLKCNSYFEF